MKKSNIIRSIFWGTIAIITLVLGILGMLEYNKIFKNNKQDLENIIKIFNSSKTIKEYQSVNSKIIASLDGKNIKIEYDGLENKKYIYKLKNGYLETKLKENDTIGNVILMVLTDSISVSKGQIEGNTYPLFRSDKVLDYTLTEGIEFTKKKNEYKVQINLNEYLINNGFDLDEDTENDFSEDDDKTNNTDNENDDTN